MQTLMCEFLLSNGILFALSEICFLEFFPGHTFKISLNKYMKENILESDYSYLTFE
jgi:hypothetical protein